MSVFADQRRASVLIAVVLLLGLVGCSSSSADDRSSETTVPSMTTTTVAGTESEGTTVLLAGDSIMRELAPALTAAIEGGGRDHAGFVLAPALPHTATDLVVWRAFLERVRPDVVVLHIGGWERLKVLGDFATGARTEPGTYLDEVVEPALDLVADAGARLLWVSPVPVRDPDNAGFVRSLARQWATAVQARSDATYLDVTSAIAPHGYADVLPDGDGHPSAVRRSDGIHLCPTGQRRVAQAIVAGLQPMLTVPPPPGWATRWRNTVHEPGGCAPYGG